MDYDLHNDISTEALEVIGIQSIVGDLEVDGDINQAGSMTMRGSLIKIEGEIDTGRWNRTEQFVALTQAGLDGLHDTTAPQGSGTNVISSNSNVLTTGTTISDEERTGLISGAEPFYRSLSPKYRNSFKVNSIADVSMKSGFINSSGEEAQLVFDSSISPNFRGLVDGEYVDSGIAVEADVYYAFILSIEVDGTVSMQVQSPTETVSISGFTKKMTANAHGMEYSVKTLAAAAKILTSRAFHISQEIF